MEAAGMALRVFREARGWSQKRASEEIAIHRNQIGIWERGEQAPALDNFDAYAAALDAPVDLLMGLVRNKTATPLEGLRAAVRYLRDVRGLSDEDIARISAWRNTYGAQAVRDVLSRL